jgi:hypothetical protein
MDNTHHQFHDLFEQLGLPSDELSIRRFCSEHRLGDNEKLSEAPFLSNMQRQFIKDALIEDADWVVMIDQLNIALHHTDDKKDERACANEPTPG